LKGWGRIPFLIWVRLGDPETEVVVPRIKNDLLEVFKAVASRTLDTIELETDRRSATTIVAVSGGYPGDYEKGKAISGLNTARDAIVFHAGTRQTNNNIVTNGGRVLAVTTMGTNTTEALEKGYEALGEISFEGMYYRKDIGFDL
jgi:phosphoribosylamine--glycine ligase